VLGKFSVVIVQCVCISLTYCCRARFSLVRTPCDGRHVRRWSTAGRRSPRPTRYRPPRSIRHRFPRTIQRGLPRVARRTRFVVFEPRRPFTWVWGVRCNGCNWPRAHGWGDKTWGLGCGGRSPASLRAFVFRTRCFFLYIQHQCRVVLLGLSICLWPTHGMCSVSNISIVLSSGTIRILKIDLNYSSSRLKVEVDFFTFLLYLPPNWAFLS